MRRSVRKCTIARLCVAVVTVSNLSIASAAELDPPSGHLVLDTTASGVQIYECSYDKDHQLGWVFKAPSATLYDASGTMVIKHSAGPAWQANDGSRITGQVMAQTPSDEVDSVPQLLLRAKNVGGSGILADVHYVQRLKTRGGAKPSANCTTEHQLGSAPYIAVYRFYQ